MCTTGLLFFLFFNLRRPSRERLSPSPLVLSLADGGLCAHYEHERLRDVCGVLLRGQCHGRCCDIAALGSPQVVRTAQRARDRASTRDDLATVVFVEMVVFAVYRRVRIVVMCSCCYLAFPDCARLGLGRRPKDRPEGRRPETRPASFTEKGRGPKDRSSVTWTAARSLDNAARALNPRRARGGIPR